MRPSGVVTETAQDVVHDHFEMLKAGQGRAQELRENVGSTHRHDAGGNDLLRVAALRDMGERALQGGRAQGPRTPNPRIQIGRAPHQEEAAWRGRCQASA